MKLLLTLPAATIYADTNRALSWRQTPTTRDSLKKFKELAPRLKELGVTKIVVSDLDAQCAWQLARRLNVPVEEWQGLRRFNWGSYHGYRPSMFTKVFTDIQRKWAENPDIPVHKGDSLTSYRKRMAATTARLGKLAGTPLVVAGDLEIGELLGHKVQLERYRVYEVELNAPSN